MSSSMSQDVPSLTSMPRASKDVEKHCPIRAMNVATHLKTNDKSVLDFQPRLANEREPGIEIAKRKNVCARHFSAQDKTQGVQKYKSTKNTKWRRLGRLV